jgi:hypothetical protein
MKRITLADKKWGKNERQLLEAAFNEKGDLVFEGVNSGDSVKERYDDFDFEYWYTIKAKYIEKIVLQLLKDRFDNISDIMKWLEEKEIPFESISF